MRILVVEDQPLIAISLVSVLEAAGHTVIGPAYSMHEAMQFAATEPVAVAIVDIDLDTPGAGLEVARRLHEQFGVCVVLSTARPEIARTCDYAFGLLSKPYSIELAATCIPFVAAMLRSGSASTLQPPLGLELLTQNFTRIKARSFATRPILVIDSDLRDAQLTLAALEQLTATNDVILARDGADALEYLEVCSAGATLPSLIVLDIRMPKLDGFEVLQRIKSSPLWRSIPVVMFSSSRSQDDVQRAYSAGANAFVRKPENGSDFTQTLQTVGRFWTRHNRNSPHARSLS